MPIQSPSVSMGLRQRNLLESLRVGRDRSVISWPDNLSWINARGGRHAAPTPRISQSVAR
jgi:hypothetical protein